MVELLNINYANFARGVLHAEIPIRKEQGVKVKYYL